MAKYRWEDYEGDYGYVDTTSSEFIDDPDGARGIVAMVGVCEMGSGERGVYLTHDQARELVDHLQHALNQTQKP